MIIIMVAVVVFVVVVSVAMMVVMITTDAFICNFINQVHYSKFTFVAVLI